MAQPVSILPLRTSTQIYQQRLWKPCIAHTKHIPSSMKAFYAETCCSYQNNGMVINFGCSTCGSIPLSVVQTCRMNVHLSGLSRTTVWYIVTVCTDAVTGLINMQYSNTSYLTSLPDIKILNTTVERVLQYYQKDTTSRNSYVHVVEFQRCRASWCPVVVENGHLRRLPEYLYVWLGRCCQPCTKWGSYNLTCSDVLEM